MQVVVRFSRYSYSYLWAMGGDKGSSRHRRPSRSDHTSRCGQPRGPRAQHAMSRCICASYVIICSFHTLPLQILLQLPHLRSVHGAVAEPARSKISKRTLKSIRSYSSHLRIQIDPGWIGEPRRPQVQIQTACQLLYPCCRC